MHIQRPADPPLAAGADGADPQPARASTSSKKRRIIYKLNAAELFENFLHTHYVGPEAVLARRRRDADPAARRGHRAGGGARASARSSWAWPTAAGSTCWPTSCDKPYGMIFGEFEDNLPETVAGDGDVKYHLGFSADHVTADKHTIHLSLTPNPSHLEAVNPVVEGRMRAKQRRFKDQRPQARHARPDPRRRRLRRPGARGRDAEPLAAARLHAPAARSTSSSTTRSASPPPRATAARPATAPTSPR